MGASRHERQDMHAVRPAAGGRVTAVALPGQALRQWTDLAGELAGDMVAGTRAVLPSQPLRQARLTAGDRLHDRRMLVPHRPAQADSVQHRPHGAADMGPGMVGGLGNARRLMLDSVVLHALYKTEAFDITWLFPKMPYR